ncbi:unnamed protein product [Brassica rapa]|uniref:Uncharacterized protein n=1 Tax=Brassica campestris TaxID=3711 RepID=A0A8D9D589_BRACM|nr:unnamed protein product [Brassica rapa]
MCTDMVHQLSKISTRTVHGKDDHADMCGQLHRKGQRADMCTDGQPQTQPTWAKITRTVHGKGQRAESKDQRADIFHRKGQRADMCTDGQPQTSFHMKGQRAESKDQHADICTDGQPRIRTHTDVLCVLTDTTGCPVCADGQPLTATAVLCVLADNHRHTRTPTYAGFLLCLPIPWLCVHPFPRLQFWLDRTHSFRISPKPGAKSVKENATKRPAFANPETVFFQK